MDVNDKLLIEETLPSNNCLYKKFVSKKLLKPLYGVECKKLINNRYYVLCQRNKTTECTKQNCPIRVGGGEKEWQD